MSPLEAIRGDLRFAGRSSAIVGVTASFLACLEAELAITGAANRPSVIRKWTRRYGKALLDVHGIDVHAPWERDGYAYPGRDERGLGRLFVMNHRSMLDVFVCLAFVEASMLSRADLGGWPLIGLAARRVGTVFVDRSSRVSGASALHAIGVALERGQGVFVYPEGTTFPGDLVRPFHAGAFAAARRANAEVVPLGIAYGSDESAFVKESILTHYRRVASMPRTRVALELGEPVRLGDHTVDEAKELVRGQVQALVARARAALEGR